MLPRTLLKQVARACFSEQKVTSHTSASQITDFDANKEVEIPVHLKPYDREKYEVPTKSIKRNSGPAFFIQAIHWFRLSHSLEEES